ncbi:putative thiamine transporter SLC35F3 [Oppia nitens]|uniref:putative thiamine transporter SLC35F3 n=1 Tax=Oppia nitens TaxID=1686743 RepID=UPI0023DB62FF|nr:putative thiamine transporter SLC35F3 [Oppia nitens]
MANIFGNFGTIWTYDIFLTFGLFFSIPFCCLIDSLVYHSLFRNMKLAGIILILLGFLVVLLPSNWNEYLGDLLKKRLAQWKSREQLKKSRRVQDTNGNGGGGSGQLSRTRTPVDRVK